VDAIERYVAEAEGSARLADTRVGVAVGVRRATDAARATSKNELREIVERISRAGGTPLVVADNRQPLGVIYLKDIVKGGMSERFNHLRRMGIKTVMITGDN